MFTYIIFTIIVIILSTLRMLFFDLDDTFAEKEPFIYIIKRIMRDIYTTYANLFFFQKGGKYLLNHFNCPLKIGYILIFFILCTFNLTYYILIRIKKGER